MSFKRHFYQLVKEDPDAVDRWGLRWEDQDSRTFCLASKFLTYTLDEGTTHNALLFALQQEWTKTGNLIFRDEHVIRQKDGKTFVYHGDFSSLETLFEQERPFVRSDVLKLGKAQKWGLFMGRIWTDTQVVSFWNDLPDFKQNDLTKLKDFLVFHMNLDINQIKLEIVDQSEYQIFSWVEMTDRIKNNLKPTDMKIGDKLHLTPPEKKGQMMKDMGIQPKINPNNIADRYKLNKESFKEYFYAFLEDKQSLTEATLNYLSTDVIRSNSTNINNIEDRNFSADYSADASSVIRDSRMDGFIGEGIFDDSDQLVGYGYGYRMGADGEYDDLEYIELDEITFFDKKFQQEIEEKGVKNICKPTNTFYFSNLVVDRPYRLYVKNLLISLINKITQHGYKFIVFDGLSDTIRLFDSLKKANRLSSLNLVKLAELDDDDDSKLVVFYIK
jgi:hypothetical protein